MIAFVKALKIERHTEKREAPGWGEINCTSTLARRNSCGILAPGVRGDNSFDSDGVVHPQTMLVHNIGVFLDSRLLLEKQV